MAIKEGKTVSPKYERRVLQASHFVGTTLLLTMALLDTSNQKGSRDRRDAEQSFLATTLYFHTGLPFGMVRREGP